MNIKFGDYKRWEIYFESGWTPWLELQELEVSDLKKPEELPEFFSSLFAHSEFADTESLGTFKDKSHSIFLVGN